MTYVPHQARATSILEWFASKFGSGDAVVGDLDAFFADPTLNNARRACTTYFARHQVGDVESLRQFASAFADKRVVASLVDSILADDAVLASVAARSYPHPIGFDKLVLHHDCESGWKLRLHIYWRGNRRAELERLHLHRFEMASAIISGELTNHTWAVTEFDNATNLVDGIGLRPRVGPASESRSVAAYSGYLRDAQGVLHKSFLGRCELEPLGSHTFVSGQAYAQVLEDAHYVETNAETGVSNGDICSTIYIHSGSLVDDGGRQIPILFEDEELAERDEIITPIPTLELEALRTSLLRYRDLLDQSIEFYDWLYDPKHGRDLSVGMIAGYLLAERYQNPHVINLWIAHETECKQILRDATAELDRLLELDEPFAGIDRDDRRQRYFAILLDKAKQEPSGRRSWFDQHGDLVKEMWRYCGAIKGEKPDVSVLKPVWEQVVGVKMPGGAHYGHIAAMIEAAFGANQVVKEFADAAVPERKADGSPVTEVDRQVEQLIRDVLFEHFPNHSFFGEESGDDSPPDPEHGSLRWLVDPIDGTRNFINQGDDWCISIASQVFQHGAWTTTDAVISHPATARIYWAERGQGAWVIERDDTEREIVGEKPLLVDENASALAGKLIELSIRGLGIDSEMTLLRAIRAGRGVYRSSGSAGLMLAQVADQGRDAAVITAEPYDVAAGLLIAKESGSFAAAADFERDNLDFRVLAAASQQAVCEELMEQVSHALEPHNPSAWAHQ